MLTVGHLTAGHARSSVLRGISFSAGDDCITAVAGPSGAGKTTLADAISGFLPVTDGQVIFDGEDITRETANARLRLGISYVPAALRLFSELTVSENLQIAAAAATTRSSRRQFDLVHSLFPEVRGWLQTPAGYLSSGDQRIVMIARAIMSGPHLLILDQPSSGLSGQQTRQVYQGLSRLNRQTHTAVLLFDQISFPALKIADVVFCIDNGWITGERSGLELLADRRIQAEFLPGASQPVTKTAVR